MQVCACVAAKGIAGVSVAHMNRERDGSTEDGRVRGDPQLEPQAVGVQAL